MLKRFEVNGYKNFKESFIIDFSDVRDYQFNKQCIRNNLLNNVIIYGKNAVGKTNFGRAIFDIQSNLRRELLLPYEREYDSYINGDTDKSYATFKYEFNIDDNIIDYEYRKRGINKLLSEKLIINNEYIFEFNHKSKESKLGNLELINASTLNWEFTDDNISILSYITNNVQLGNSEILAKFYKFIVGMQFIRGNSSIIRPNSNLINRIIERGQVADFQEFLNNNGVDEKLTVINNGVGEKILCFKHKKNVPFFENCSSGTLALVRLYSWKMRIDTATFLYMDEFDAFYHYELSEKVIKLFGEIENCQTIVTSHNTNLLSNKIMRPDCFFILTKEKITSIVNATERELREGHNLQKLYKSGEFGE